MNLFNIGVEGQFRLAACVAAIVGGALALPPVLHTLVIILVAALVGRGLGRRSPALLKAYRGVSEVISTIMLNFIAIGLIAFLIRTDAFGVLQGNNISTDADRAERAVPRHLASGPPARCSGWCSWPPRSASATGSCSTAPGSASSSRRPASRRPRPPRAA